MIVKGKYKGTLGRVSSINQNEKQAIIVLEENDTELLKLPLDWFWLYSPKTK